MEYNSKHQHPLYTAHTNFSLQQAMTRSRQQPQQPQAIGRMPSMMSPNFMLEQPMPLGAVNNASQIMSTLMHNQQLLQVAAAQQNLALSALQGHSLLGLTKANSNQSNLRHPQLSLTDLYGDQGSRMMTRNQLSQFSAGLRRGASQHQYLEQPGMDSPSVSLLSQMPGLGNKKNEVPRFAPVTMKKAEFSDEEDSDDDNLKNAQIVNNSAQMSGPAQTPNITSSLGTSAKSTAACQVSDIKPTELRRTQRAPSSQSAPRKQSSIEEGPQRTNLVKQEKSLKKVNTKEARVAKQQPETGTIRAKRERKKPAKRQKREEKALGGGSTQQSAAEQKKGKPLPDDLQHEANLSQLREKDELEFEKVLTFEREVKQLAPYLAVDDEDLNEVGDHNKKRPRGVRASKTHMQDSIRSYVKAWCEYLDMSVDKDHTFTIGGKTKDRRHQKRNDISAKESRINKKIEQARQKQRNEHNDVFIFKMFEASQKAGPEVQRFLKNVMNAIPDTLQEARDSHAQTSHKKDYQNKLQTNTLKTKLENAINWHKEKVQNAQSALAD